MRRTAMTDNDRTYIDDRIERYMKSLNAVLLTEIQELKTGISKVETELKRINGSVRDVCEWKAGHQAVHDTQEKTGMKTLKQIGVIIAFLSLASGMYFGFRNINERVDVLRQNYEIQERYLRWKFGETPVNPATRGAQIDLRHAIDSLRYDGG